MSSHIAALILGLVALPLGLGLLIGKLKLVIVRRESPTSIPCVTMTEQRKKGRPRKDGSMTVTTRHLFLPQGATNDTLTQVSNFFNEYRAPTGNKVVLHAPSDDTFERDIELPFYVQWNAGLEQGLSQVLGGWA